MLEADGDLMAVSGLFYGEDGGGFIGQCQRNEFARYQRYVSRSKGRVFVLTGTASLFRACAYQAVSDARGTLVPGPPGKVYDTLALTEDNELTLALKTLGAAMLSPIECRVVTEVMPDWRALYRQRLRWHRGALENIGAYGFTRATAIYWFQQLALGYGVVALQSYFLLLLITVLAADTFTISWFWAVIGAIFVVERVVTAWSEGWRGRLLAAPIFLELGYVVFLQYTFLSGLVQIVLGRQAGWNYVPREVGT
ncbi:glycosyltransferase family 2 protein [Nocardioides guangzhouensis]|uniref:glycosyltransferase family 2 protein n=1 Tax=Nocardioides guangzhouensis TaxID=2497878 RepID=UPI001C37BAE5|nr:glycosyltransferase family 2 protein [Nocardioides guangzhouensis]